MPYIVKRREGFELNLLDKLLAFGAGIAGGAALSRGLLAAKERTNNQILKDFKTKKDRDLVSVLLSFAVLMPEKSVKYMIAGMAGGIGVDNIMQDMFKTNNIRPVSLLETNRIPFTNAYYTPSMAEHYSYMVSFDENLPTRKKEEIVLPMFPRIIKEQRSNPAQTHAIERYKRELGIIKPNLNISDTFWMQQWMLYWGKYTGNEGLWEGHDRFRTLGKLMRVRDEKTIMKDGHPSFEFDCDDHNTSFNQVVDSYGYPVYSILISQKPKDDEGMHSLHHILPAVKYNGRLWAVEGIRPLPIIPIEYLGNIFHPLTRVVLVNPDGTYHDIHEWKKNLIRAKAQARPKVIYGQNKYFTSRPMYRKRRVI